MNSPVETSSFSFSQLNMLIYFSIIQFPDSLPPVTISDDNEDDVILSRSRTNKNNDQGGNETERLLNIDNVD